MGKRESKTQKGVEVGVSWTVFLSKKVRVVEFPSGGQFFHHTMDYLSSVSLLGLWMLQWR